MFLYKVEAIKPLTKSISQIFLTANDEKIHYEAGQYAQVQHANGELSALSIANAPNEKGIIEFHLSHPQKNKHANELLEMAVEEKSWSIVGPFGECSASRLQINKPIIFFAQGTGFAPIKAIIETFNKNNCPPSIHFYWSLENEYLFDLVKIWQTQLPNFIFSSFFAKEITPAIILQDHKDLSDYQVYASGSQQVMQDLFDVCIMHSLRPQDFYSDSLIKNK